MQSLSIPLKMRRADADGLCKIRARGGQSGPGRHVFIAAIDRESGRCGPYLVHRPDRRIRGLIELTANGDKSRCTRRTLWVAKSGRPTDRRVPLRHAAETHDPAHAAETTRIF
jgi:hypothetical protein